jgi:hypothetical protein
MEVVVYGWPSAQATARLGTDNKTLATTYDASTHALHVVIPDAAGKQQLVVEGAAQ